MSNEIFKWQPQMVSPSSDVSFYTVASEFENGMTQRGLISSRERNKLVFTFKHALLTPGEESTLKNEILVFFKARQGAFDNFFLPSWKLEAVTLEAITVGDNTFKLSKDPSYLGFSKTIYDAGNYLYFCRKFARGFEVDGTVHEINRITDWEQDGDDWVVTVEDNFTNSYPINIFVQKAYKANFATSTLKGVAEIPYGIEYQIEFIEDLAQAYQTNFGLT